MENTGLSTGSQFEITGLKRVTHRHASTSGWRLTLFRVRRLVTGDLRHDVAVSLYCPFLQISRRADVAYEPGGSEKHSRM